MFYFNTLFDQKMHSRSSSLNNYHIVKVQKISILPPWKIFFCITSPLGNSSLASYFSSKSLAIRTPPTHHIIKWCSACSKTVPIIILIYNMWNLLGGGGGGVSSKHVMPEAYHLSDMLLVG